MNKYTSLDFMTLFFLINIMRPISNILVFIYYHSCMMFVIKFISICNDYVNYDGIII